MSAFGSVVDELEMALRSGSPGRRTDVMRQVTSLFLTDAEQLSSNQIELFDDVMNHLVEQIETTARAELSARLAPVKQAPHSVLRKLAADDSIEVAGPILEKSERLTDEDLVEIARTKGQAHQLSIASRPFLNEAVTEALIDKFDAVVANKVAGNVGARFSTSSFSKLALIADGNDELTKTIASRKDVPPRMFRELLSRATETVRENLLASAPPSARHGLTKILSDISGQIRSRVTAEHYAEARRQISDLIQDTALARKKLVDFAKAKILGKTVATLSLLSAVPVDLIDRLMHDPSPYGIMVLCRVLGLEWTTTVAVLSARPHAEEGGEAADLDELQQDFDKLTPPIAQRLLRFWQSGQAMGPMRTKASAAANPPPAMPAQVETSEVVMV
jgi:hypothetical protein